MWYIGFYIDDNEGGTFRVDHLVFWERPICCDDIQDTTGEQVVDISAEWDLSTEKSLLSNDTETQERFNEICQL